MDITPGKEIIKPAHKSSNHLGEEFKHWFDGVHFKFPTFKHDHPPVINVNEAADDQLTVGQRVADKVASGMGSWRFIITQACILILWIVFNSVAWFYHFDGYPYILLNLVLSFQAGFAAPIIMMSQNRQAEKDRLTAQNDYITDCKGEEEIRHIMEHLDHQDTLILQVVKRLEEQHKEMIERFSHLDPEMAKRLGTDLKEVSEDMLEANSDISGNS